MNFSIDTNIILGIANNGDRIHEMSIALIENKRNDHLFLCKSAIKESHNVFRNRINEVIVEIFRFFPDIYHKSNLSSLDCQFLIIENFKKMKSEKPGITNFLNLVFHEISLFLKDNEMEGLPTFLSELSLNLSRSILMKISEIHRNFEVITLKSENLSDVKKSLAEIHFKDSYDERIFLELITNLYEIKPIEFFLDDKEFAKNCKKGFSNIVSDMEFEMNAFSCKLLKTTV
ncbi:MAG: hypothetical protein MPEBLZ_02332 [Candidatus Methanoperedens nitroreducens]|uniref:PIN domain-containing protein n=1 Tax=Candidatus Methanoperedens nitratireducens TaxID=1392998 RepID=A0A0P8DZ35_9EURY|nr:hypothetical protein [Candidatus Methanoperedens sp. BLZ2]KAB2947338.1 MAG: hypothetical protein F9K14_04585 [Candidatus Methanoperedens sp.]KPQ43108.1 MAG: hypothetical protein MPEBLZ_02332 [Candidatus Methanoperedens sp. BLZ1]MBZ0175519.1 hypothetical protein [Candidatus Methanoperedens nitroreducens]CAG0995518.1 hypothetical protein METP2_02888 [Methanosarcinales archaeon]MCX9080251.1 hypothetical protein [Candidatus Methanoperedens sp.]